MHMAPGEQVLDLKLKGHKPYWEEVKTTKSILCLAYHVHHGHPTGSQK